MSDSGCCLLMDSHKHNTQREGGREGGDTLSGAGCVCMCVHIRGSLCFILFSNE